MELALKILKEEFRVTMALAGYVQYMFWSCPVPVPVFLIVGPFVFFWIMDVRSDC